ncbi:MAG: hypothetical protein MUF27_10185 [Acidobacteria bacterium]|nr:hypothetical protein [Acidobacteriota bacterium]
MVAGADQPVQRRLRDPQVGPERRGVLRRQRRDLALDLGRERDELGPRPPDQALQPERLGPLAQLARAILVQVDGDEQRLGGQEGVAAYGAQLVLGERGAQRDLLLQLLHGAGQDLVLALVLVLAGLLDHRLEPLEPPLCDVEVGQQELGLDQRQVACRVDRAVGVRVGRIVPGPQHQQQRVGGPQRSQQGVVGLAGPLLHRGRVDVGDRGVGRLLRLEERHHPVEPRVGDLGDAAARFDLPSLGQRGPGEDAPEGRLPRAGQAAERDFHRRLPPAPEGAHGRRG